jgi:2-oxoisovalerate dehydrogenase E2 component (dihydrolipoyl transacylase)
MKTFYLPDLGEGLPDAEIRTWHIKEGDEVKVDDIMVSLETAKAVVDVPAPRAGKIHKLWGNPGDVVKTGAPLVEFSEGEEYTTSNTVAGSLPTSNKILQEAPAGIKPQNIPATAIKILPAVRALAKQLTIDISTVTPTGPNGQITIEDISKAAQVSASSYSALHGVRRQMALGMEQAHREVVPVTVCDDADIAAWPEHSDITLRIIRALIKAIAQEPALNAYYDGKSQARQLLTEINLGLAIDNEEGLFVPVIKHVDKLSASELRTAINDLKERAKQRSLHADEFKGASVVLSNFGKFAGRYANPIVIPPTVAILGSGRCRDEVVASAGQIVIHKCLPLSLTFDHRAVTGGEATRFLKAVLEDLQTAN